MPLAVPTTPQFMPLCVDFNVQQKKTKILNNAAKKRIWEA
jgi:hypothetical protein